MKTLTLYKNELYKIFVRKSFIILLVILLLLPFIARLFIQPQEDMRIDPNIEENLTSYQDESIQQVLDSFGGYDAQYHREMAKEESSAYIIFWLDSAEKAKEDFEAIVKADKSFASRFYVSDLLLLKHMQQALLDPKSYGIDQKVYPYPDNPVESIVVIQGLKDYSANPPVRGEENGRQLIKLINDALETKEISAYAKVFVFVSEFFANNSTGEEAVNFKSDVAFFKDIEERGELSTEELYLRNLLFEKRIQLRALERSKIAAQDAKESEQNGGGPLTPMALRDVQDKLAIQEYNFKHNFFKSPDLEQVGADNTQGVNMYAFCSIVSSLIIIAFVMIKASISISQEIETGSVKLLIIAPVKRWKIYLAKILAIVTLAIILVSISYVWNMLWTSILSGENLFTSPGVLMVYHSKITPLTFGITSLFEALNLLVKITFYAMLSILLSTLFRKTPISLSASIIIVLIDFFYQFIREFTQSTSTIMKWTPFYNLNMVGLRFQTILSNLITWNYSNARIYEHALEIAILYTVVFTILFIWAGMENFMKQDI